jgi:hypothetical protein
MHSILISNYFPGKDYGDSKETDEIGKLCFIYDSWLLKRELTHLLTITSVIKERITQIAKKLVILLKVQKKVMYQIRIQRNIVDMKTIN